LSPDDDPILNPSHVGCARVGPVKAGRGDNALNLGDTREMLAMLVERQFQGTSLTIRSI
jgi:hypothetical protein